MAQEESEGDLGLEKTAPSRRRLVVRFALLSLLAFALVGVAIHLLVANQVRKQHEEFVHFHAVFVADQVLSQMFTADDVADPVEGSRHTELARLSEERVLVAGVLRFDILRPDGTIVFSDQAHLIGTKSVSDLPSVTRALSTGSHSSHQDGQIDNAALLETYVPIRPEGTGSSATVARITQDFAPAQVAARKSLLQLDGILFGGLILIYILLLPIASRTGLTLERYASRLRSQATALAKLLSREKETVRRMKELDAMKSDFVATASHELRTPLTGVMGTLKTLMREEIALDPKMRKGLLEAAVRQANKLLRLIEQLLEASVLDRRERQAKAAQVDFGDLAETTVASMGTMKSNVTFDIPPDLGSIESDPEMLEQILINLVDNAIKYSPPDSTFAIGARRKEDVFVFSVKDRGIGMTQDQIEQAFEPFWQADGTSTRKYGGVGLGLHIVRGLVQSLDGKIGVESSPGEGSIFTVMIPDRRTVDELPVREVQHLS